MRGTFEVIADGHLDAADPRRVETVEVAFPGGQQTSCLDQRKGWTTDDVPHKVRADAVAATLDFRRLYENDGDQSWG